MSITDLPAVAGEDYQARIDAEEAARRSRRRLCVERREMHEAAAVDALDKGDVWGSFAHSLIARNIRSEEVSVT